MSQRYHRNKGGPKTPEARVVKHPPDKVPDVPENTNTNTNTNMNTPDNKIVDEIKRVEGRKPKSAEKLKVVDKVKKKFFVYMLGVSALVVAGCAAFFSVRGISLLFSGSLVAVFIMAAGLEYAKLIAATYLHRYWKKTTFLLKTYLTIAVVSLVVITSLGIYGFLSDAFEKTRTEVAMYAAQIETLGTGKAQLNSRITQIQDTASSVESKSDKAVTDFKQIYDEFMTRQSTRRSGLLSRVSDLDTERSVLEASSGGIFSSKKKKLQELESAQAEERESIKDSLAMIEAENKTEYDAFLAKVDAYKQQTAAVDVTTDIESLYKKINDNDTRVLELKRLIANTDIGSFKFIARAFDVELDIVVKWFIVLIVLVFDPLSVCLVLAYNTALKREEDE
jgi:hypothetical protein